MDTENQTHDAGFELQEPLSAEPSCLQITLALRSLCDLENGLELLILVTHIPSTGITDIHQHARMHEGIYGRSRRYYLA